MGSDLAMAGIGLRSNFEACKQLMDGDLLGTRRFAVVRDDFDQNQVRGSCVWIHVCVRWWWWWWDRWLGRWVHVCRGVNTCVVLTLILKVSDCIGWWIHVKVAILHVRG